VSSLLALPPRQVPSFLPSPPAAAAFSALCWDPDRAQVLPLDRNFHTKAFSAMEQLCPTTPTGNNPGWICDCRKLYLTQELDLLCMGIVVVLTKSFNFLLQKK
jgi:hypothetical protein